MSKVIAFLEALGEGNVATEGRGFEAGVDALGLDPELREALLARDQASINRLLGGRPNVYSLLVPAEEDDKKDEDQDTEEQPEKIRVA